MKRLVLITLTIAVTLLAMGLLWVLTPTLVLFGGSLALSAALRPLVARLEARRVPRGLAIVIWYGIALLGLVGVLSLYGLYLSATLPASVATLTQAYQRLVADWERGSRAQQAIVRGVAGALERLLPGGLDGGALLSIGSTVLGVVGGVVGQGVFLLAVLALAYYWLAEVTRFERVLLSVLPVAVRVRGREIWRDVESAVGTYIRTTLVVILLAWVLLFTVYAACGLPFAATLGLVGGLAYLLPRIGPLLGVLPAFILGLLLSPLQGAGVLLGGVVVLLLTARVSGALMRNDAREVNPLLQVLVLLALVQLGGIGTMILAPPLAALIQVLYANLRTLAAARQPREGALDLLEEQLQRLHAAAPAEHAALQTALTRSATLVQQARTLVQQAPVR